LSVVPARPLQVHRTPHLVKTSRGQREHPGGWVSVRFSF
jgi:hypothetical protein